MDSIREQDVDEKNDGIDDNQDDIRNVTKPNKACKLRLHSKEDSNQRASSKSEIKFYHDIKKVLLKKKADDSSKDKSMKLETILLKLDKMNSAFKFIKSSFTKFDQDSRGLTQECLVKAIQCINSTASVDRIRKIFDLSDIDTSRTVDFKEYLTALVITITLDELPPPPSTSESDAEGLQYDEFRKTLDLIMTAYLLFDPECQGHFSRDTLHKDEMYGTFLNEDRWNEMVNMH